ncbi:MAG: PHP domain-containing protein [Ruminococcus sp.]|nr:PHP domain-containing protein [Ruminococcus sp.]
MFKYETHLHTTEASACASASGAEQARHYKELGYDGIIVTDHFFNGNTAITTFLSWEDRVNKFCKGYENAKAEGNKIGLKVFFGFEYGYYGADILTYGVGKDFLLENDNICDISFYQFAERVHKAGGILVHAHPFREADWYIHEIKLLPKWIDAVEVYNSGNGKEIYNERAEWYADQFGFVKTAGSDNHVVWFDENRISGITTDKPLESIEDYIAAVRNNEIGLIIPPEKAED